MASPTGSAADGVKLDLCDLVVLNANIEFGYYTAALDKDGRSARARPLQRLRRHRPLHARRPAGDRAQQLVRLPRGLALERHLRHPARRRAPDSHGRLSRAHSQRRRFRHQLGRPRDHRDDDHRLPGLRPERDSRVRPRAQGHAVRGHHRRLRPHHERGQQWRLRQRLAGRRPEYGRNRAAGARPEERHPRAHEDGYFAGANFPINPKLAAEETNFKVDDPAERQRPPGAVGADHEGEQGQDRRRAREAVPERPLDAYERKATRRASARLCGHVELRRAGWATGSRPGPAGTVQSKVADAAMARG